MQDQTSVKYSFDILTLFPQLIEAFLQEALIKKAIDKKIFSFQLHQLRDFSDNKYKSVDDKPYGHSDGMVLRSDIADRVYKSLVKSSAGVNESQGQKKISIYMSPQGRRLDNQLINELKDYNHFVILCGRYGGVDQRVINNHVDLEVSIGDYVLSGGELGAMVLIESFSRFIEGVVGDETSVREDSFQSGLLEAPQFTKPSVSVPEVLLSGHHQKIVEWKYYFSIFVTLQKRPDLKWALIESMKKNKVSVTDILNYLKSVSDEDLRVCGLDRHKLENDLKSI